MNEQEWTAQHFEEHRSHLRAVAYRMLGSASEADDAVQEAWLRLTRSDTAAIENLGGWLTTVVARVCLDLLRSRASRKEEALEEHIPTPLGRTRDKTTSNPERDVLLSDSVGVALQVVLDRLTPAERIALVLHDIFDVSFDEIASIVGRSPAAARQLASRARRKVRGDETAALSSAPNIRQQRAVAEQFLHALRAGDVKGLIAVLDPDIVVHIGAGAGQAGAPAREIRGAETWARGAVAYAQIAQSGSIEPMLVNGAVGLVWAPGGQLSRVLRFVIANEKITEAEILADPARLRELDLALLD